MKLIKIIFFLSFLFFTFNSYGSEASNWLKKEIDKILVSYQNPDLPNQNRFLLIEQTINNNFAGKSIAVHVAKKSYKKANKETRDEYIQLFKRHLALNITSLMQGYSNQEYKLIDSRYDEKNQVNYIDMQIIMDTGTILVTWRVLKHKERYFVIDLIISGISLVETKRSEFNSLLKTFDYNLTTFNKKLANQNETSYQKIIK